uniref:VWFA domain-containing protein n=1 Tax=Spongospora subterranea TaxID=70186 RepID=A0A0H5R5W5_9EUKA|eukprot:CRZ03604.1 hypothetical protein [Spongospora subterranea]
MDDKLQAKVSLDLSLRNIPRQRIGVSSLRIVAFLFIRDSRNPDAIPIGHTDLESPTTTLGSTDLDFSQQFVVEYFFEESQTIIVHFYQLPRDRDALDVNPPSQQDFMGKCSVTLGDLVCSPTKSIRKDVELESKPAKSSAADAFRAVIRCEKVSSTLDNVTFDISAQDLDNYSCCLQPSTFLELCRIREDLTWQRVHYTEVIARSANPFWKTFTIPEHFLCGNDVNRTLRFNVLKYQRIGVPVLIGYCDASLGDLIRMTRQKGNLNTLDENQASDVLPANSLSLINMSRKKRGNSYKNSGILTFMKVFTFKDPSFLDYLMSGLNVRLIVALDFTASNGDPSFPDSLHYIDSSTGQLNPYERAIADIGNVLAAYDSDQMFPVWGFGAKIRATNKVSHLFSVTFDDAVPEVHGINEIIKVYRKAFGKVQLSGPTMFSEMIDKAANLADDPFTENQHHYHILLIITDGVVNDRSLTIGKLIEASDKPLSIIIIGVGNADFTDMHFLDSDDRLLEQDGKVAKRDIVQFVEMKSIRRSATGRLAAEVLAEVPDQVVSFMKLKGITPKQRPPIKKTIEPDTGQSTTGSLRDLRVNKLQQLPAGAPSESCDASDKADDATNVSKWKTLQRGARIEPQYTNR